MPVGVNNGESEFNTVNKTGGNKTVTLTVEQMPKHTHSLWAVWANVDGSQKMNTGSTLWQNYQNETGSSGGSQPHTNLQPYVTCYMWRRTA